MHPYLFDASIRRRRGPAFRREIDQALFAGLQKSPYQIELYQETLELTLFPDGVSQRRFREEFIRKYSGRKLDAVSFDLSSIR